MKSSCSRRWSRSGGFVLKITHQSINFVVNKFFYLRLNNQIRNHLGMSFSQPALSQKPPIFIVGCPRSGTALIRDLLRSHPNLTFPKESHFIPQLYKAYGNPDSEPKAVRLASIVLNLHWVQPWGLDLVPSDFADCRSYNEIVTTLYEAWAIKDGRGRWGDKTPQNVFEIKTLVEIFPSCQILHILRDGRDVAISWIRATFGPENVYTAALEWKRYVETGRNQGGMLSAKQYLEIHYEHLLQDPSEALRRVCSFLGETYCEEMLTPRRIGGQERRFSDKTGKAINKRMSIIADNRNKSQREMGIDDRVLFESLAGDLLSQLGYCTEGKIRSISTPERLKWIVQNQIRCALQKFRLRQPIRWIISALFLRWALLRSKLSGN